MKIKISTRIEAKLQTVKEGFNEQLFLSLNPPFPPVRLLKFGGCQQGDRVVLELNFILFKQCWESIIVEDRLSADNWTFIDEGVRLPFGLKHWRHRHIVRKLDSGSVIIDDISYQTGTLIMDVLFYPAFYLLFIYRRPVYKKHFARNG